MSNLIIRNCRARAVAVLAMLLWLVSCGGLSGKSNARAPATLRVPDDYATLQEAMEQARTEDVILIAAGELNARAPGTLRVPDDYATVHEAMEQARAGDVILIAAGEHRAGLRLKSGVTLRGAGRDHTILWSATEPVVTASAIRDVRIENMRLEGRYVSSQKHTSVWVTDAAVALRGCHVRGATLTGIEAEGTRTELVVSDSVIEANQRPAVLVHRGAHGRIEGSLIRENDFAGIGLVGPGTEVVIFDNLIAANRGSGIQIIDGAHGHVERNRIWQNRSGIMITGKGTDPVVIDNLIAENRFSGIQLLDGARGRISRNAVIANDLDGVVVKGAKSAPELRHNVLFRNQQNGIWVLGKASARITDNIIAGNRDFGIAASGGRHGAAGFPFATHNLLWDNKRGSFRGFEPPPSNMEGDPGFLDTEAWDFRLAAGSPARGAGSDEEDIGLYTRLVPPSAMAWRPHPEARGDTKAESYRLPAAPKPRGRSLAVVVGVQSYEDPGIKDLKYTGRDAERVATFLQSRGYEVRKLIDDKATLVEIRGALLWLASAGPDDRVVFYFSGHGSDEPNPLGTNQGFLLTFDTRLFDASKKERRLAATALPLSELSQAMDRTAARRVSVLLDACFAAGAKSVSAPRRDVKSPGEAEITGGLTFGEGKVALYSSRDNEPSLEADRHRQGYFTHYLLEAWQAGKRSADEVYRHVHAGVTRETNGAQHPRKEYRQAEGTVPLY